MTDFMVHLSPNFRFVYQFSPGTSQYKCVEACLAMAGEFAKPDYYPDPKKLMSQIYIQYVGPDVASDRNGTTKAQALDWLHSQNIGVIDMQHFIDAGQFDELKAEIQAQNRQGVPQILSIGDESFLKYAKNGQTLHNWADALNHGSHSFFRVGYSDSAGDAYYMEPAAAPNFAQPVPILWEDIMHGAIVGCLAIMPPGVPEPPAGFSFQHGVWPAPKPTFDQAKAELTLTAALTAAQALQAGIENVLHDLAALKGEI